MPPKNLALPLTLLFAGALLGLIFSAVLIYEHNGTKTSIGASVCDPQASNACEKAKNSAVGRILGLPLALYGYVFYGAVAALAAYLLSSINSTALSLLFWGTAAALLFDGFLLVYSLLLLDGVCRLCAITYGATALSFVGAWLFKRRSASLVPEQKISRRGVALSGLAFALVVATGILFHTSSLQSQQPETSSSESERKLREQLYAEFYRQWKNGEILQLEQPKSGVKGAAKPVLTIIEFADLLCPHCRDMAMVLNGLVQKYPDKVRVVFRHYPLDMQCNGNMKRQLHPGACDLARATECAEAQGRFWAMHDAIFIRQEMLLRNPVNEKVIESLAQAAGADVPRLLSCYKSQATLAKVKSDIEAGNRIKVSGTPTTIANNRRIPSVPLEFVPGLLEKILAEESQK
ncbi:MAG: thioredoxin domain-containing protein [Leptospiraceae bacterium]|nr:thioredoxin domain-containing protein [Leptospiraceae bacterium]